VFWELNQLTPVPIGKRHLVSKFLGYGSNKGFAKHFVPEHPMIVTHP